MWPTPYAGTPATWQHAPAETYGHDLATGASVTATEHAAARFDGRARLKATDWEPPPETPDDAYPMQLMTGRTVYQFHTRTKTGRAPELNAAAPEPWVELAQFKSGAARVIRPERD